MNGAAGGAAGAGAAAAVAAMIQATKAMGVIVKVEPDAFLWIVEQNAEPLVVHATGGFFTTVHRYLTSHRGLAFFTEDGYHLALPTRCQMVEAKKIWLPG